MKRQNRVKRFHANTSQHANTRALNGFESLENRTLLTTGLSGVGGQIWNQNTTDIAGGSEAGDAFGEAVAVGDFNTDGFDDMAVGVPGESIDGSLSAGAVNVVYGSEDGLSAAKNQVWHQDSPGIAGGAEAGDQLGAALAVGDFNDDGYDDLAIGAPLEDIGGISDAGAVNVIYGSSSGLTATGDQLWHQDSSGIRQTAEDGDHFGWALTVGDFDGNGIDDLAIGVPGEDLTIDGVIAERVGAVNVLYGTFSGLTATDNQLWHQSVTGMHSKAEVGDAFGSAIAAGDFDADGYDDLVVGAPGERLGDGGLIGPVPVAELGGAFGSAGQNALVAGASGEDVAAGDQMVASSLTVIGNEGQISLIRGSSSGLTVENNWVFHQHLPDGAGSLASGAFTELAGTAEALDSFGAALAVGDFDGDGFDDLAVGVPDEDIGDTVDAGAVNTVYGSSVGLTGYRNQVWRQGLNGVTGIAEDFDQFGASLAVGDFDNDGKDDLVIGVPGEDTADHVGLADDPERGDEGQINVLYGTISGLSATGNQYWHQQIPGVSVSSDALPKLSGRGTKNDRFGTALATGDFNGDGAADLAIGVPGDDDDHDASASLVENVGAVNVIYGAWDDPGFDSYDLLS